MNPTSSTALLRLCHLVSPALPVGAYNFSQGLEYAVHAGWVKDEATTTAWIQGIVTNAIATLDVPVLLRLHAAWQHDDVASVRRWSAYLVAARETQELRAEERHMGKSLAKVLVSLDMQDAAEWTHHDNASYACLFALAATRWQIDANTCAQGYLWAWCENQVLAALKVLPIGQSAGQRMLNQVLPLLPALAIQAANTLDGDIALSTPLHGMASASHETQYSRLFRS